jgi:hypothetical protein
LDDVVERQAKVGQQSTHVLPGRRQLSDADV